MPIYTYKCLQCDNSFDKLLKMDERKNPELEPCSLCGSDVQMVIGAPSFAYTVGQSLKHSDGFNDRLKEIKTNVGKTVVSDAFNSVIR